ncbi:hypothetical protein [Streptomyces stelliscabiei]|uniref:hypothetical protein n=1 Tax=Streptomyces stelliscabiei TaxID=146820 RepID=UPI002FF2254D
MLPAEDSEEAAAARAAVLALRRESGMSVAGVAWVVGPGQLRIGETSGVRSRDRRGLSVPAGAGLIGKVLTTGRPAAVSDYRRLGGSAMSTTPSSRPRGCGRWRRHP